jgi:rhodanese-related sulfurtransferase
MEMMEKDASYVLLDLRSAETAKKAHIKGAVSVPMDSIQARKQIFPEDKSAPIILYADKTTNMDAFKIVRKWGYKNVSVMKEGMEGWQKAGGKVATGDLATSIVYVKKLPKNEIGIEEFKMIVEKQPSDKIILDVRDADTIARGSIKGSLTIPLDDLDTRLADIPKNKEVIIHCNTGIMAGMAQKMLDKKGYRSRILNAVVQVASDGTYEVAEK